MFLWLLEMGNVILGLRSPLVPFPLTSPWGPRMEPGFVVTDPGSHCLLAMMMVGTNDRGCCPPGPWSGSQGGGEDVLVHSKSIQADAAGTEPAGESREK